MSIALCFVSYADCEGMYRNYYDVDIHDIEETIQDAEKYYESIGIEEFMIADTWSDDSKVERVIVADICYSESYTDFKNNVAKFVELLDEETISDDESTYLILRVLYSELDKDVDYIIDKLKDHCVYVYSDINEVVDEYAKLGYTERESNIFDNLWNYFTSEQEERYIKNEYGFDRISIDDISYYYTICE